MHTPAMVSVIICTCDRPASFQRALASVLVQDIDGYEVIVIDGSDPPVDVPDDASVPVRVIHGERRGEGRARASGLAAAEHDLIAWCDDDDTWTPDHLRVLRDALLAQPGVALVYAHDVTERPPDDPLAPARFSIRAGDVLHRARAARAAGGFDHSLHAYAAGDLWARMEERGKVLEIERVLTTRHEAPGVAPAEARESALQRLRQDWEDTARRAGAAHERVERRKAALTPFNPATWNGQQRRMIFQTVLVGPGSFPVVSRALIQALLDRGVQVTLGPIRDTPIRRAWGPIGHALDAHDMLGLVYDFRTGAAELHGERTVLYSMWETTVIPACQIDEINRTVILLYTPCRESASIARANGIEPPARVLHHGVDPERFPLLDRPRTGDEPFTFGSNGVLSVRKGIDVLMRAFGEAFAPHEPVRLILKHTYNAYPGETPRDPRITLTTDFLGAEGLREFLRGLDAYVLPSRGEGFGLTGIEAMATGLPLIATNWSGPAEYLDPADTFPLRYRLEETGGPRFQNRRQFGLWAEPDVAHLRELLRYVYEHRGEAAGMGRRASARVHRDWTWGRIADQLIADFDLLAQGISPGD